METERTKLYNLTPSTRIFLKTSNFSRLSIDYFSISKIISVYKFQELFDYVFENVFQLKYPIKQVGSYLITPNRKRLILSWICKYIYVKLNKANLLIIFNNTVNKLLFLFVYLKLIIQFLLVSYCITYNTTATTTTTTDNNNNNIHKLKHLIYKTNVNNDDEENNERNQSIKLSLFQLNKVKPLKCISLPCCTSNGLSRSSSEKVNNLCRSNFRISLIWIIIFVFSCSIRITETIEQTTNSTKLLNQYNLIDFLQSLTTISKQINSNILTISEQKTWNYLLQKIIKSQISGVENNQHTDFTSSITTDSSSSSRRHLSSIHKEFSKYNENIQKPSKEELIAKTPSYMFKLHERHMNDWHSFGRYESNHILYPDYVKYLNENQLSTDKSDSDEQKSQNTHQYRYDRHHLGMITAIRHHKHIDTHDDEDSESNLHPLTRSKRHVELQHHNSSSKDHVIKRHKLVFQLADIPSNEQLVAASIRIRYEAKLYLKNYTIPTEFTTSCINATVNNEVNNTSFYWPLSLWLHSDQNNTSDIDVQTAAIFEPDDTDCKLQRLSRNSSIMNLPDGWFHIPLSQPVLHLIEQINKQTDNHKQIVIQIRSVVIKNLSSFNNFDITEVNDEEIDQSNYLKIRNLNQHNENSSKSSWLHNAPHLFTYHRDPNLAEYLKRKPRSVDYPSSQYTLHDDRTHNVNLKSLNNNARNKKITKRYKRLQRLLNAQFKQQNEANQQDIQHNKENHIKLRSRRLAQYRRHHNRANQDRYYYTDSDSAKEIIEDQNMNEDVSSHRQMTPNSYDDNRGNHRSQQQYKYDITRSYHTNLLQSNNHHYLDTTCQRRELIINFDAVGWAGWVIAPQAYNARYCLGQCPFPLSTHYNTTNHAVLLQLVHLLDVARISGPCCVPHQLSSQSLLYHSQNGDVVLRVYEDMVVESCACR
ncbi:Protein DVR-1 [Schistosoma japonicum]|nr:Protein DVR-1 [Schistosoma japonicum]